jgi:hypothetical protein
MATFPEILRFERKFLAPGFSLAEVLALVRRHPAIFREVYPPRFVNNLYLDSAGLRDYFDHVSGVAHRAKTRLRWYGPFSGQIDRPTLERKIKRGQVSGKVSHALPSLPINGGIDRHALAAALEQEALPAAVRPALQQLEPSLLNRYQRRYFLSADGRFRLTVDSELQFACPRGHRDWIARLGQQAAPLIVEVKYAAANADSAPAVSNAMPFRVGRCSKYVLGIDAVG